MIGIGIIGCGKIAQVRHIPEYMDNDQVRIVGVTDANSERAAALAKRYAWTAYPSVDALLADGAVDAVSVCTANHTHAEITVQALRAGKHVLCEKPMGMSPEECRAMVAASDASGKILMIDQNQRLAKAHVLAQKLIGENAIGKVLTFRTTFGHGGPETWSVDPGKNVWFFDRKKAVMGAMADLGIHKTDLIQFLLGEPIVEVRALLSTLDKKDTEGKPIGVDDNAVCIYRTESGIVGTMTASWTYYGQEDNSTVLYGTEGIMHIYDDPAYSVKICGKDGSTVLYDIDRIQTNDNQTKSGVIDAFVSCIAENRQPEISGRSVLSSMQTVFAAVRSSQTGRAVKVDR